MIELEQAESKPLPITKGMVWKAYLEVKRKGQSAGVDEITMMEFDHQRSRHLYKIWNRLASGSYFPPHVLQVEIPKQDGSKRLLGVPTISDRIAQTVVKHQIEDRLEKIFHPSSYGYRPKRSAHQALQQVRENCWRNDWVIDLDIKNFFEEIDHQKLLKAVDKHVEESWIRMYITRWLTVPTETSSGKLRQRSKGTPQGGVISPLLANLYLHYTLDAWLAKEHPGVKFVRYADDIVIHCRSKRKTDELLQRVKERMEACGLHLHPNKTKIVYCKDMHRKGSYKEVKFDFLGYTFQPRTSQKRGELFLGYDCAISIKSRSRIFETVRKMKIPRMVCRNVGIIAYHLNPKLRGWIRYFGKYKGYCLTKVFTIA